MAGPLPTVGHFEARTDSPDFTVEILPDAQIQTLFGKDFAGLSVTDRGATPVRVVLNRENWTRVPRDFEGSLKEYRRYLVLHEVGHVLGLNHVPWQDGAACPTMMQQTRGTRGKCRASPWPTDTPWETKISVHEKNNMLQPDHLQAPTLEGGARKKRQKTKRYKSAAHKDAQQAMDAMEDIANTKTLLSTLVACENMMCGQNVASSRDLDDWKRVNQHSTESAKMEECAAQGSFCSSPIMAQQNDLIRQYYSTPQ